jgi:hypothetical protein
MTLEQATNVYRLWHDYARTNRVAELIALYAEHAVLESPLVAAILDCPSGVLAGRTAIGRFLEEGTRRRPNPLVRWYRTDEYFYKDSTLIWEYPRQTPDGDQVDILEVMQLDDDGKIKHHRIYWGWFGCTLIAPSLAQN